MVWKKKHVFFASLIMVGILQYLLAKQNMAWTKISGKLCVCKYICQSFFFMNETLAIEQSTAWTKISGKLCVCKYVCQSFWYLICI